MSDLNVAYGSETDTIKQQQEEGTIATKQLVTQLKSVVDKVNIIADEVGRDEIIPSNGFTDDLGIVSFFGFGTDIKRKPYG